jgi:hypothetical protein
LEADPPTRQEKICLIRGHPNGTGNAKISVPLSVFAQTEESSVVAANSPNHPAVRAKEEVCPIAQREIVNVCAGFERMNLLDFWVTGE